MKNELSCKVVKRAQERNYHVPIEYSRNVIFRMLRDPINTLTVIDGMAGPKGNTNSYIV
jgi:hypothetical protein